MDASSFVLAVGRRVLSALSGEALSSRAALSRERE